MKVRVRRKNRHKKITDKYSTIINSEYEKRGHYFVKNKDGEYVFDNFNSKWGKLNEIYKESKK
jgi:hypothetical protein